MIKINNIEYDATAVVAQDGTMSVRFDGTTQTLSDIEALFNSSPKIEIWEDNELTATYFDKKISSIYAKGIDDKLYDITIYLVVSKLEESAEKVLQMQIDNLMTSVDAIKENNTATDNAVDDLGTATSENATTIEELAIAIDDLATLVAELVADKEPYAETIPSDTAPSETEISDGTTTETTEEG